MTGKQRALSVLLGVGALFSGGALVKTGLMLGPLTGCLLLLYGTVCLVCSLTDPGEKNENNTAPKRRGVFGKIFDSAARHFGWLALVLLFVVIGLVKYLEGIKEKIGFSVVGVILVGAIFFVIDGGRKK